MIVDKNPKPTAPDLPIVNIQEDPIDSSPMSAIYNAVRDILKGIPSDPNDPNSAPLFKSIKMNFGQRNRIKHDKHNFSTALAFPAAFINFINVRWLVQTSRIGEGRAEMRICYILNRLNNDDDDVQTEGYDVFQRIHDAMIAKRGTIPSDRCQLTYWDQVENFDDGMQTFWITYEVWFRDYSTYRYRDYVQRYVTIPPHTNRSDLKPENNPEGLPNHAGPSYDEASKLEIPKQTT